MTSFYNRQFEILVNGEAFIRQSETGEKTFRVVFDSLIDFGGYNSYLDISFYNLAATTREKIFKRNSLIVLRAGYDTTIDTIFSGRIRNVFVQRDGASIVSHVVARGGNQDGVTINKSFGKNAKITDIIKACVAAMGYPIVLTDSQFSDIKPYSRGYVASGNPYSILDKLAAIHGFSFAKENERVVVVRNGESRTGNAVVISRFTGMEGIPKIGAINSNRAVEVDVDSRLNPQIRIGGRIEVQSEQATFSMANVYYQDVPQNAGNGIYNVNRIRHAGDSWGDKWTTSVNGLRGS